MHLSLRMGLALAVVGSLGFFFIRMPPRNVVMRPPPDVILITIDTLRADRLSCYQRKGNPTPNIDRLAAEGALFVNAFCDVTWTTPSMSSVMTGTYETRHGMRSTYQQLDPANVTLAEELKQHGYHTAAIIGSFPLAASFGLDQGFDTYDDHFTAPIVTGGDAPAEHVPNQFSQNVDEQRLFQWVKAQADAYRPDNEVSDAAIAWLHEQRRSPFFLWVHYFGPHELGDRRLSVAEQDERIVAVYNEDVRRSDREVGRFLDAMRELGLDQHTLTILHADHGQSLGEHLYVGHGKNLYDPTLRIPLIMRLPGVVPPGTRVGTMARNIDIMPTVLETVGVSPSAAIDGKSLHRLWKDPHRRPLPELYCETYLPVTDAFAEEVDDGKGGILRVGFRRRGVLDGRWKLVVNEPWPLLDYANPPAIPAEITARLSSEELYDVDSNPLEMRKGLVSDRPDIVRELRAKIDAYNAIPAYGGAHHDLDEAAKQRLRSLGYLQ
jgi:arylsulfatase A-like enzyme